LKIVQGQIEQAEVFYRKVVALNPNDFQAYNNLALLLAYSGKSMDESLDLINRAIQLAGSQSPLLDSRAVIHIARHEPQRALEDLDTILNDPAEKVNPVWLFHKAWALKLADNVVDAGDVLHQARNEHDLDRAQIDPPERASFDKLIDDLK
jgi:tetratricopeptide (TPR) repeat protein